MGGKKIIIYHLIYHINISICICDMDFFVEFRLFIKQKRLFVRMFTDEALKIYH